MFSIAVFTFMLVPFVADANCSGTFCGTMEVSCTSGPCSTTVNEDGSGSITCGGSTIPISCDASVDPSN